MPRVSRQLALLASMTALVFGCFVPIGACVEVSSVGPYTTWFNHRMMDRANAASLVGQPEANVELVLGRASSEYAYPAPYISSPDGGIRIVGKPGRTFDYYPYPLLPVSKFQVHCTEGVVTGLEMFDD